MRAPLARLDGRYFGARFRIGDCPRFWPLPFRSSTPRFHFCFAARAFAGANSICPRSSFTFTVTFGSNLLFSTFDDSLVLLDDVVQVLRLTHLHGQAAVGLEVLRLPPCWRRSCRSWPSRAPDAGRWRARRMHGLRHDLAWHAAISRRCRRRNRPRGTDTMTTSL